MKKIISFFLILVSISAFIIVSALTDIYKPKNPSGSEKVLFEVKRGEGIGDISKKLYGSELISSAASFRIYVLIGGFSSLQAGAYYLFPSLTIPEIVQKMARGDVIRQEITIIEGWKLSDLTGYLEENGLDPEGKIALMKAGDYKANFDFLEGTPDGASLEGFLFPDTYWFSYGTAIGDIVEKILGNFDKKLTNDLKQEIESQGKSVFEIVTMASLIEKEVRTQEDKELVSGILWKRIRIGMPLQVDATIGYITGKRTTDISIDETKIDSHYNTYKYRGLPPGPISNPGIESIMAAVYPKDSDYLFYLSTPEGKTIFSRTLQEHNIAKAKYLK